MFANMRPLGREYRITPSCSEKAAGRASAPPKSPVLVTRTQRCASTWSVRGDGFAIRRDALQQGIIPMYTPKNETPRAGEELGADEAVEATNLNGKDTKPASKLFAEADRIIETFPSLITKKSKYKAESQVLRLFLAALAASRVGRAV